MSFLDYNDDIDFSVYCPEGWHSSKGYCLKAVELADGFAYADANAKCEELGGFIAEPLNDMTHNDIQFILNNQSATLTETHFWIGMCINVTIFKSVLVMIALQVFSMDSMMSDRQMCSSLSMESLSWISTLTNGPLCKIMGRII